MKFTPSSTYKSAALGSGKYILTKAYVKVTNSLSGTLTEGTWTDISLHLIQDLDAPKMPTMWSKCEWQVGKPKFGKLELVGIGIPYWRTLFDSVGAGYRMEFKCQLTIGFAPTKMATDIVYGFSGWVDTQSPKEWNERENTVKFSVISHDEEGARISAETLVCQPIRRYLGPGLVDGLVLRDIPGTYETDTVSGTTPFPALLVGIHTIEYNTDTGNFTLDGGAAVAAPATDDFIDLLNEEETEGCRIFVDVSMLPAVSNGIKSQDIIVQVAEDPIAFVWYQQVSVKNLLGLLYTKIGLTSQTIDTLSISSWDGNRRSVALEVPPGPTTYYGKTRCMVYDDVNDLIYLGIGEHLYLKDPNAGGYGDLGVISSGKDIIKLFPDLISAESMLMGILIERSSGNIYLFTYNTGDGSVMNVWALSLTTYTMSDTVNAVNIVYLSSYGYIVWCPTGVLTYRYWMNVFDGSSGALISGGYTSKPLSAAYADGDRYFYQDSARHIVQVYYSGGTWHELIKLASHVFGGDFSEICADVTDVSAIITIDSTAETFRFNPTAETYALILSSRIYSMVYYNNCVYFFLQSPTFSKIGYIDGASILFFNDTLYISPDESLGTQSLLYDYSSDDFYFTLERSQTLFIFSVSPPMYVYDAFDCEDKFIIDQIRDLEKQFNLIGVISTNKKVKIYRRSDEAGNPKSSGSVATIVVNEAEDIKREEKYIRGVGLVIVDNGNVKHSYNGVSFDPGILGDVVTLSVNAPYIPDNLTEDWAKYLYLFFYKNFSRYTIPLANVIKWEYECFDGCTITFATTHIIKTGTGIIYGIGIDPSGSTIFEVLLQD